jgi:hypothetical protein
MIFRSTAHQQCHGQGDHGGGDSQYLPGCAPAIGIDHPGCNGWQDNPGQGYAHSGDRHGATAPFYEPFPQSDIYHQITNHGGPDGQHQTVD